MKHVKIRSNVHFLKARLEGVRHCQAKQDVINLSHAHPPLLFVRCTVPPLISTRLESVRQEDLLDFGCSPCGGASVPMVSEHAVAATAPACGTAPGISVSDVPGGLQKFPALWGDVSLLRQKSRVCLFTDSALVGINSAAWKILQVSVYP